ncbi:MAG: hypothetical protein ACLPYY_05695 [Acidimicrobiales bacterium]
MTSHGRWEVVHVDEEDGGTAAAVSFEPEAAQGVAEPSPMAPGWYPTRANPSDQTYWDGENWTARRRWTTGKGWVESGEVPAGAASAAASPPVRPRLSANPYAPVAAGSRSTATGFTFSLGVLVLLVCGIALMFGSVGSWVHVSGSFGVANFHASINGTDPGISTLIGVNGWVTFIGGILLVIFGCSAATSEEVQLAIFTAIIAAATAVFAIYDMFRMVQKISQVPPSAGANISVGWGLICVLSAAVLATLIAIVKLIQH